MGQPADLDQFTEVHAGEVLPELAPAVQNLVTAQLVERFEWLTFASLRGFVFNRDGVRLGGMITLHVGDEAATFETEWKRYSTTSATVIYTDKRDAKDNPIIDRIEWGPFSDLTKEEAWGAIEALITSELAA